MNPFLVGDDGKDSDDDELINNTSYDDTIAKGKWSLNVWKMLSSCYISPSESFEAKQSFMVIVCCTFIGGSSNSSATITFSADD